MQLSAQKKIRRFEREIKNYYRTHGRSFPWRNTRNPYHILVSEIMLQQTQASRVIPKYQLFIKTFPTFRLLARAPLKNILRVWQGLGYNRRALALKNIAERVVKECRGTLPSNPEILETFPGIGHYTARAITTFAFNEPVVCIETNIRTVFIRYFFTNKKKINDRSILRLVERTLDRTNPRTWYWALMDYGAMLKETGLGNNTKSAHYRKQSTFRGSNRELRGKILKALLKKSRTIPELAKLLNAKRDVIAHSIAQLTREGLVEQKGTRLRIV